MKKHGLFMLAILLVFVATSLAMPVMAEKLIQGARDKVLTQEAADAVRGELIGRNTPGAPKPDREPENAEAALDELIRRKAAMSPESGGALDDAASRDELLKEKLAKARPSHTVSDQAMAAFVSAGKAAFENAFGETIPADYKSIKTDAYEVEGDVRFYLSLMPENWEESTDTLTRQEKRPYYEISFGGVDPQTGAGDVIGLQRFWLGWEDQPIVEANYTGEQLQAMEEAARGFAEKQGFTAGELVSTDKVAGSYDPGCVMVFALPDGQTVSVTVSEAGAVSGYSMVEGKG